MRTILVANLKQIIGLSVLDLNLACFLQDYLFLGTKWFKIVLKFIGNVLKCCTVSSLAQLGPLMLLPTDEGQSFIRFIIIRF